jgi:hypothetical protein
MGEFGDALDLEGVLTELAADEVHENAVQVATDGRAGVEDTRTASSVKSMRRIEECLAFAMQRLNCKERQKQRRLNLLEWHARLECVTI